MAAVEAVTRNRKSEPLVEHEFLRRETIIAAASIAFEDVLQKIVSVVLGVCRQSIIGDSFLTNRSWYIIGPAKAFGSCLLLGKREIFLRDRFVIFERR